MVGLTERAARPLFSEVNSTVKEIAIEKLTEDLKPEKQIINEQKPKQDTDMPRNRSVKSEFCQNYHINFLITSV